MKQAITKNDFRAINRRIYSDIDRKIKQLKHFVIAHPYDARDKYCELVSDIVELVVKFRTMALEEANFSLVGTIKDMYSVMTDLLATAKSSDVSVLMARPHLRRDCVRNVEHQFKQVNKVLIRQGIPLH